MAETDFSKYTVLVVDDIPTNILLVKGMLSKLKFNIVSANSGQQALDLLARTRPDIILMDILMPGMNGFETTRAIRSNPNTADIPVIMLSALNSDTDIKTGLEAGANEFISKPFIQEHIVNCIITQINLSESKRKKQEKEAEAGLGWDAAICLLASMACCGKDDLARRLGDLALSVPLPFIDESLHTLPDYTSDSLVAWTSQRLQSLELKNGQISVNECLTNVTGLLVPAAKARKITWNIKLGGQINVVADPVLLKAVFTNLMSCACQSGKGEVTVSGNVDGGLANIVISCTPDSKATVNTDFRVALALEVALKMNGAVTYEQDADGQCRFQVLLQTWQK